MLFERCQEQIAQGAVLFRGRALAVDDALIAALDQITATAPFRQMVTPGGFTMSVAMTNCGRVGWVTDRRGYRYEALDPLTGLAWPPMPPGFQALAVELAAEAGYREFQPDLCLINRYQPGARLSLHQDKDERSFAHPIVSVSLGICADFQFGGCTRQDPVQRYRLCHGDVVVWGGASRLCYHGVLPLKEASHPRLGRFRVALTFRRAL